MIPLVAAMPTSQLVLRALVLLGPVVALLATGPAGHWPPWWAVVAVLGLAGAFAAMPDSPVGAGLLLVVLVWWTIALGDDIQPAAMVAAAALLVAHLAAQVASYGPATQPVAVATLRLWGLRAVVLLATVPATWAAARLLRGQPEPAGVWILATTAAVAATVAATVTLGDRREA
ncbi:MULTISPECIES: hypothetical protein [unclassified Nocardioides]|uniref:hypothetical protein n=1 Tax=unclassified Nocardioides TaxID=2615069 RepID=UPI0009F0C5B5|nr:MULTISPECIES: hypothetical protein [unclassified Nocardioides]GAW52304.1 uncharacterized protein PD653B2_4659 [Nocardioides sp. PD653-B2]GAW57036.1 uncharacterized protein PD653_4478 [Nocardioides sp. PD653]